MTGYVLALVALAALYASVLVSLEAVLLNRLDLLRDGRDHAERSGAPALVAEIDEAIRRTRRGMRLAIVWPVLLAILPFRVAYDAAREAGRA